ncbi:hypothetical protein [Microlunatus sp. Y2014]|uniref:hypothetical protein n=1 Tax=Microlunatus sp. Y2014 TaxID=3418488 RepID=UPI003DA6FE5A
MTGSPLIDAAELLRDLATRRPVFHSEADFQFAFAWEAKSTHAGLEVRLETHPEPAVRLDLELRESGSGRGVAVEVKYMTRHWSGTVGGEGFSLKDHDATDLGGYDVIKDVQRVERFAAARPGWSGMVIALTNDPRYWRPPTHGRSTNADAFRLGEGEILQGERTWGPKTGGGTSRGREAALTLSGSYKLAWADYARLDQGPGGTFRYLLIQVEGQPAAMRAPRQ